MALEQTLTDDFAHLTMQEYVEGETRDQFFDEFTLLGWMEKSTAMKRIAGGSSIVERLNIAENDQGGSYSGTDTFSNTPDETIDHAYYDFSKYEWPITSGSEEVLRNRNSPAAYGNLWMEKADIAMKSLRKRLNTDAQSDGTGNSGKNMEGLAIMIDSTTTYATLSRTTVAVWAANETAVGGALALDGANGMVRMYNDVSLGSGDEGQINALFGTQNIVEAYEALLQNDMRFQSGGPGDGGFGRLTFKGKPFLWDRAATSGVLYYIANSTFKTLIQRDRDFFVTPIQNPENGTAQSEVYLAHILLWIALVCVEPRRNGKLTGIS